MDRSRQLLSVEPNFRTSWRATRAVIVVLALAILTAIWVVPPLYVAVALAASAAIALTLRYPIAGMTLLAFSVPWASGVALPVAAFPVTLTDMVVAALGAAWLVSAVSTRGRLLSTTIWLPYLALFTLAISLSVTQAADPHAAIREIVKWIELGVVYFAATHFLRSRVQLRLLVAAIVLAGVSQAVYGYVQFLFGLGPQAFAEHRLFLRAFGSFDQPNPFAGYLNMTLPFSVTMSVLASRAERQYYRLAAILIAGAIFLSQSRGAALAGMVGLTIVAFFLWPRYRPMVWTVLLTALIGGWGASYGLVSASPFQRVLSAIGLSGVSFGSVTNANFSAIERAAHWLAGVRMFAAHPLLGVGIGNYSVAYPAYHPRGWYDSLEHAHNYYINVAAESGMVGLACYVLLVGSALWYSVSTIRLVSDSLYRAAVLGVLGALVATNFHNLFDVLYVHGMVALLGLLMALIPGSLNVFGEEIMASNA